jgi:hypothetical protein
MEDDERECERDDSVEHHLRTRDAKCEPLPSQPGVECVRSKMTGASSGTFRGIIGQRALKEQPGTWETRPCRCWLPFPRGPWPLSSLLVSRCAYKRPSHPLEWERNYLSLFSPLLVEGPANIRISHSLFAAWLLFTSKVFAARASLQKYIYKVDVRQESRHRFPVKERTTYRQSKWVNCL